MTARRPAVAPVGTTSNHRSQCPENPNDSNPIRDNINNHRGGVALCEAPGAEGVPGAQRFQDWCLRTYGDSGKTKTVTRRKYQQILQTLLRGGEEHSGALLRGGTDHVNAKFKFWVKSKGFRTGFLLQDGVGGSPDRGVLMVPVRAAQGAEGGPSCDVPLKRVAVVEDFYDIIYTMHVDATSDPTRTPKHAGQKKTYRAIAEMYAFLPREAVTRFLMSCGECQKRMHITTSGLEFKENDWPTSPAPSPINYNISLTTSYLQHMRLCCGSSLDKNDSVLSSEDEMSESTWLGGDAGLADRRVQTPPHPPPHSKDEDDDSSSESGCGNGLPALTPPSSAINDSSAVREAVVVNGNGGPAPLDFSTPTSSSCSSEDQQPVNLSDSPAPRAPPAAAGHPPLTVSAAAAALLGALHPDAPEELRRKYPLASKTHAHQRHTHAPPAHAADLRADRDLRDYEATSPQYSCRGSYDSVKMELGAEDLTTGRHGNQVAPEDDDDDHDDHEDSDKINDGEGVDPERLKAFNMFVRLFVDENLDRMVPISKQPKEKIQAIIESCSRQFPEFQERARKRIRTYLKSCRRMKKNGMETRPTPPHLTSAMAENILAAACESESRKAAKRIRLEAYHEEQSILDKPASGNVGLRDSASLPSSASLASSTFSLAASAFSSQDAQLYINGAGYGYRGYTNLGATMLHPVSLMTSPAAQSNGPTDLSMKPVASSITSSTTNSLAGRTNGGGGAGGASTQLSQPEITAVRQLIAGYRESAAFLLRSADELENLILQQN